ncbi:MAG: YihY/virulence factor BrkB family protein [Vicinamibacterales bacterium]
MAFTLPVGPLVIARRTVRELVDDNGLGLAAALAYYFFLALFPALLFVLAAASFFAYGDLADAILTRFGTLLPPSALQLIQDQLGRIADRNQGGLLTVGLGGALWTTSTAVAAIVDAMNRAYDVIESRPWWQVRLISIGLTLLLATGLLVASAVMLSGGDIGLWMGVPEAGRLWPYLQWPGAIAVVVAGLTVVYKFAADVNQGWFWCWPGAVLATVLWLLASAGFRLYVTRFGGYTEAYGAVGSVIVLLVWLYLLGLAIVAGAELNSELEHASLRSDSKAPGEKRAGAGALPAHGRPTRGNVSEKLQLDAGTIAALEDLARMNGRHDLGLVVRQLVAHARRHPKTQREIFAPDKD